MSVNVKVHQSLMSGFYRRLEAMAVAEAKEEKHKVIIITYPAFVRAMNQRIQKQPSMSCKEFEAVAYGLATASN
jgi:hypothetical protein